MAQASLKLYHYWRSSSSYRVRLALAAKGLLNSTELIAVNLLSDESDQPAHLARNPAGYVPVLESATDSTAPLRLIESVAIIEYLDEAFPGTLPLLSRGPGQAALRAHSRALAELINAGIQPLQNLTAMARHSSDPEAQKEWVRFWIRKGLGAYSAWAESQAGRFSVGDQLSYADLFLIPQCYSSGRFGIELGTEFPLLASICANADQHPAVQAAHPDRFAPRPAQG